MTASTSVATTTAAGRADEPRLPDKAPDVEDCTVFELRQYTMVPGRRETLIALFDREFVETQEAVGMRVVGTFRDVDRPDYFVWMRAYADMPARQRGLEAFYGGPVWAEHRNAANATMVDAADVLLLRHSALPGSALAVESAISFAPLFGTPRTTPRTTPRPPRRAPQTPAAGGTLYSMLVLFLTAPVDDGVRRWAAGELLPRLERAGNSVEAVFETEYAPNNFPRLPVREGEHVLAVLARGAEGFAPDAGLPPGGDSFVSALRATLSRPPQFLRLQPTARSLVR